MGSGYRWETLWGMRILAALDGIVAPKGEQLIRLAREHELIVSHRAEIDDARHLRLILRNALPERDVVTVLIHVVVLGDPDGPSRLAEPQAIAELRSLRALVEAGSLVLCGIAARPVSVDGIGEMRAVDASVDTDRTTTLLARRLDADMLVILDDGPVRELPAAEFEPSRQQR